MRRSYSTVLHTRVNNKGNENATSPTAWLSQRRAASIFRISNRVFKLLVPGCHQDPFESVCIKRSWDLGVTRTSAFPSLPSLPLLFSTSLYFSYIPLLDVDSILSLDIRLLSCRFPDVATIVIGVFSVDS